MVTPSVPIKVIIIWTPTDSLCFLSLLRGMDPIVFAALCGVGTGIAAYMIGGALFKVTWQLLASKKARQMQKVRSNGREAFYNMERSYLVTPSLNPIFSLLPFFCLR